MQNLMPSPVMSNDISGNTGSGPLLPTEGAPKMNVTGLYQLGARSSALTSYPVGIG